MIQKSLSIVELTYIFSSPTFSIFFFCTFISTTLVSLQIFEIYYYKYICNEFLWNCSLWVKVILDISIQKARNADIQIIQTTDYLQFKLFQFRNFSNCLCICNSLIERNIHGLNSWCCDECAQSSKGQLWETQLLFQYPENREMS